MRPSNQKVAEIVFDSFRKAFAKKDQGALVGNNSFRSSYFVSLIGEALERSSNVYKILSREKNDEQRVEDYNYGCWEIKIVKKLITVNFAKSTLMSASKEKSSFSSWNCRTIEFVQ